MPKDTPEGHLPDDEPGNPIQHPLRPDVAAYWLAAVIESADDAIITKTLDGVITSWNPGAQKLFGYTPEEAIGRPVTMLIPEDHLDEEPAILARIRAGERIEHYETVRRRKDGTLLHISLTVSPIRKPDGTIIGASKIARDITGLRGAEETLRAQAAVIAQAYDAIFLRDSSNAITLWNRGAERTYGYTPEEALGRSPHELLKTVPPVPLEEIYESLRREGFWEGELLHTRKDGEQIVVETRWATVRDERGQTTSILEITRDVTERRRSEVRLRHAAAIVENSDDAIISKDLDGIIQSWNPGAERLYGYTPEEAVGQPVTMLIPDDRPDEEPSILARIRRGERVDHYETVRVTKDGRVLDVSLTVSPVRDSTGRVVGASKIARDITERKRAEAELSQSRAQLQTVFENATVGLFVMDDRQHCIYMNPAAEKLTGYTLEEVQGRPLHYFIHHTHPDGTPYPLEECPIDQAFPQNNQEQGEDAFVHKDGSFFPVAFTASPLRENGRPVGTVIEVRDTTEEKRAAAEREHLLRLEQEAREEAETLYRLGQVLSAELDLHKLVQAVTDAATELTGAHFGSFFYNVLNEEGASYMLYTMSGVPREAFAHFPMPRATDLFGPTFRGDGTILIGDVKLDPRFGKNSPFYGMPEGHLPVTSYLAVPVISRSGEVYGGLFFGHPRPDVFTGRAARIVEGLAAQAAVAMDNARLFEAAKRARAQAEASAAENERLYREAREASRLKDEFLATVSHELRTPLTAILGWAHMLRTGQFKGESAAGAFETIERNARAQSQLIEDLLDVSRIITGKLRIDVRPIDPNSFIDAAVEAVRPAAEAKGVRLQRVLDTGIVSVSGDPVRLQQVVWNLLSNALKFTPRGGRVQVRLERVNSHVEITVSDTGAGISPEFLPHVFDRFRQADQKTTRRHGGLGLGLAIVRHLVELHGGTVRAESEGEGHGSTFTVLLPVAPINSAEPTETRVHPAARDTLPAFECPDRLDGLRILIVDDEPDTREMLKAGLMHCGAVVTTAGSAAEAVAEIQGATPDVLISDIGMPEEDGYDLIRKVRALPAGGGGRVPAIALTAYARAEDRMHALRVGYQMHVPKPVELAELAAVVASIAKRDA
ncbi:MAG TPA: PAS domain S-box protein [Pyrinomonadaceae bacterium]|jgi:PAS domain S-box-containing protein|nr:PAS domain S-box protein [Pyrinomonadaceae bacterium]